LTPCCCMGHNRRHIDFRNGLGDVVDGTSLRQSACTRCDAQRKINVVRHSCVFMPARNLRCVRAARPPVHAALPGTITTYLPTRWDGSDQDQIVVLNQRAWPRIDQQHTPGSCFGSCSHHISQNQDRERCWRGREQLLTFARWRSSSLCWRGARSFPSRVPSQPGHIAAAGEQIEARHGRKLGDQCIGRTATPPTYIPA